jgi:cold shock CspA family protein
MLNNVDELFVDLIGDVAAFDEVSGLGVLRSDSGSEIPFHCISIADGTRTIAPSTRVRFSVAFRVKRAEAINLVTL